MQDVVPPADRSIRNVPLSPGRRRFSTVPADPMEPPKPPPIREEWHDDPPPRRKRSLLLWGIAVVVVCVLLGILVSAFFAGATVTVYPKTMNASPSGSVLATLDAPVGSLSFETMILEAQTSRTVPASGTKPVSIQASGKVTIYNAYSTASQKLIANTRFEAPDGKIYRIRASVTVPGQMKKADGTLEPGSVAATVYADSPGPDYNRGSTRFTIPGFKNDPRYEKFYATADSIGGGASGNQPAVSQSDLANARKDMEQELAANLASEASGKIPEGYLAVPGAFAVTYGDVASADAGGGKATVTESAVATAAIIRGADLANAVAKVEVPNYEGEAVGFADPSAVTLAATGTPFAPSSRTLMIELGGTPTLVWQFDPAALAAALAGKPKDEFQGLLEPFKPAVDRASASIRPFWKSAFPAEAATIKIVTKLP